MVCPAAEYVVGLADFEKSIDGSGSAVTVSLSSSPVGVSFGSVELTLAALNTEPASMSACVVEYVAVQVRFSSGASTWSPLQESDDKPSSGSAMATLPRVTLPVFLATKV